jgi:hypothetical protein
MFRVYFYYEVVKALWRVVFWIYMVKVYLMPMTSTLAKLPNTMLAILHLNVLSCWSLMSYLTCERSFSFSFLT